MLKANFLCGKWCFHQYICHSRGLILNDNFGSGSVSYLSAYFGSRSGSWKVGKGFGSLQIRILICNTDQKYSFFSLSYLLDGIVDRLRHIPYLKSLFSVYLRPEKTLNALAGWVILICFSQDMHFKIPYLVCYLPTC